MNEEAKRLAEWLNHYIKTDPAHKVIARKVFGHNGDCGNYGEDWMWLDDICKQTVNMIESLSAQLEQVTRERDAAVSDIDEAAPCFACIRFERNGGDCIGAHVCIDDILQDALGGKYADYYWQWRGVREVE